MKWETVIGLEVHVQLATKSKLFCGCAATFGDRPNSNVCPVCLGLPGALPVTNREAVRLGLRAALALGFTVHGRSQFARKNYFYPDLPKGYQISQFERPLATDGRLRISSEHRGEAHIALTRLHLEEDAGKSLHDRVPDKTGVDYNRAGVPLAEVVSEPDLRSPAEARTYLNTLKLILQYLDVSDCNMEEGHLRVDANLSVRPDGDALLGVKQEIKNMNSFAGVERALGALRVAQIETLEAGEVVERATFSAATDVLRMTRTKEESHDYRYFPEPDLPAIHVADEWMQAERMGLPELPAAKRLRLGEQYGLPETEAGVLIGRRALADYFEALVAAGADPGTSAHWVVGPVLQDANEHDGSLRVDASRLAELIGMVAAGQLSRQAAGRLFRELPASAEPPRIMAERLNLLQVSDDDQLVSWVQSVIDAHPKDVERLRGGEDKVLDFFMGQIMRVSRGRADPNRARDLLRKHVG